MNDPHGRPHHVRLTLARFRVRGTCQNRAKRAFFLHTLLHEALVSRFNDMELNRGIRKQDHIKGKKRQFLQDGRAHGGSITWFP